MFQDLMVSWCFMISSSLSSSQHFPRNLCCWSLKKRHAHVFFFHCLMVHGPGSGRKDGWIFTGRCGSGSEDSKADPLWTMLIALIKRNPVKQTKTHYIHKYIYMHSKMWFQKSLDLVKLSLVRQKLMAKNYCLVMSSLFVFLKVSSSNSFEGISLCE